MNITTPHVRGVGLAYREFYSLDHTCQHAEGQWPYLIKDGLSVVCKACEWAFKRPVIQDKITEQRLSMPVDPYRSGSQLLDRVLDRISSDGIDLLANPTTVREIWRADLKDPPGANHKLATGIAGHLARLGHVVFYVHRSQAINLIYGQRETEAEDVLLHAPVLVFWSNADARGNASRIDALIEMRQGGYTFVLGN